MTENEKYLNELCNNLQNAINNNTDENGLTFYDYQAMLENARLDRENLKYLLREILNDNEIDISKYTDKILDLI